MTDRIELIKANPIIDVNYKPSMEMDYVTYFNRAMLFAQTNYQDQLTKLANTHFKRMTPSFFYEEYAWAVCILGLDLKEVATWFASMCKQIHPYFKSFSDLKSFPSEMEMKEKISSFMIIEDKIKALHRGADIIYAGSRLYGWTTYRDNYLNTVKKLEVLPMIGSINSSQLARNIGLNKAGISGTHLNQMAARWGFKHPDDLCESISKHVVLQPKVIGQILWYAGHTFGTNF